MAIAPSHSNASSQSNSNPSFWSRSCPSSSISNIGEDIGVACDMGDEVQQKKDGIVDDQHSSADQSPSSPIDDIEPAKCLGSLYDFIGVDDSDLGVGDDPNDQSTIIG